MIAIADPSAVLSAPPADAGLRSINRVAVAAAQAGLTAAGGVAPAWRA